MASARPAGVVSRSLTHNENRSKICLMCFTKPKESNRKKIQDPGPYLTRIKSYFMENYDPTNQYMPNSICSRCAKLLLAIETAKDLCKKQKCNCTANVHNDGAIEMSKIPDPIDFSALEFPTITRQFIEKYGSFEDNKECFCSICKLAKENCGWTQNTFGGKKKGSPLYTG